MTRWGTRVRRGGINLLGRSLEPHFSNTRYFAMLRPQKPQNWPPLGGSWSCGSTRLHGAISTKAPVSTETVIMEDETIENSVQTDMVAVTDNATIEEKNQSTDVVCLLGMNLEEMTNVFSEIGLEPYRAKQVWRWMYHKGITNFDQITELKPAVRKLLSKKFSMTTANVLEDATSLDGTRKWLFEFQSDKTATIETVWIPEHGRGTMCLSSQCGCSLSCTFCHTGTQRMIRNLTTAEILDQLLIPMRLLNEFPLDRSKRSVTNIVMMGMGEPLYNYRNVKRAILTLTDPDGVAISRRRITLSTSGVVPAIKRLGEEVGCNLAISLHAVRDDLRNVLVPINRMFPLRDLIDACRSYGAKKSQKITFEYVMLKGVNDTPADARELVRLIRGIPAIVNLIPFNVWPGTTYEPSPEQTIFAFQEIVEKAGIKCPIRWSRGEDILAACGQLKGERE